MKKFACSYVALLLIVSGCSSSKITTMWKTNDASSGQYNKILVLGVNHENDRTLQEKMENHFVGDLKDLGYNAISSLEAYGPKAFDNIDEETALEKLKNSGVDAVMTIVLLNKEKERRFVTDHAQYSNDNYYNTFWSYRTAIYTRIYEPGYYVTSTKYFWESNFYEINSPKLIYSVQTQSFDPSNSESMAHEYGRMIVKNMVKQKVLAKHQYSPATAF
jgi:hypothetical protein